MATFIRGCETHVLVHDDLQIQNCSHSRFPHIFSQQYGCPIHSTRKILVLIKWSSMARRVTFTIVEHGKLYLDILGIRISVQRGDHIRIKKKGPLKSLDLHECI